MAPTDADWCGTCQESCRGHPTVCTVCGEDLEPRPTQQPTRQPTQRLSWAGGGRGSVPTPPGGEEEVEWQAAPPEALDPQAAAAGRPASRECVARIPRIRVGAGSSILHQCTVALAPAEGAGRQLFDAVVAEFGPSPPYVAAGRMVRCLPATGRGGLGSATSSALAGGAVAYLERGGGVTFARKALLAQRAGAAAVVVGNSVGVWPYVMQDTGGEARGGGLTIPVVMVKRSDGRTIRSMLEGGGGGGGGAASA